MKLNFKLSLKPPFIIHDVSESAFVYGSLNGQIARKHKKKGNVQFILWYAGTQGHTKDYWHNFDKSHWSNFKIENK